MKLKKIKQGLMPVVSAVAMECVASQAWAAIDQTTASFGASPASLTFNRFDPALGTLTAVRITLDTRIQASIDVGNNSGQSVSYSSFTSTLALTASGPDFVKYGTEDSVVFPGSTIPAHSHHLDTQISSLYSATFNSINPNSYIGLGTFILNVSAGDEAYVSTPGGALNLLHSAAALLDSGNMVTVAYDYIPASSLNRGSSGLQGAVVPEPATYLAGITALGMLYWGRRNNGA